MSDGPPVPQLIDPPDVLAGEGLRLRAFLPGDASPVLAAVMESIAELAPYETWATPGFTRDEAAEYVEYWIRCRSTGEAYAFAVEDPSGRFLGTSLLSGIERAHGRANLGFWVRTSATGRGVATGAARLIAGFGFTHIGLHRIEILSAAANIASRRVAEKLGADLEGILRRRLILPAGTTDCALYALLREDDPAVA